MGTYKQFLDRMFWISIMLMAIGSLILGLVFVYVLYT